MVLFYREGKEKMPIYFDNVIKKLREKGYPPSYLMENKILSSSSLAILRKGQGNLDTKTVAKICNLLDCQPGEFQIYINENEETYPPKPKKKKRSK